MGLFDFLFGKRKQEVLEAIERGARIIDVRTPQEFKYGYIDGSVNIPLERLNDSAIKKLKKLNAPLVVCCASGMRSASAKGMLIQNGIAEVHNAGGWHKLDRWLNS
ncbi:rhodanese-like domain-containing protein [Carboxylicivirga mesophila]|uniref:Rhodanese-like domain-containing protein n=1 Tax=Carboxylicivirga mesophila TaxID=1166478 RepID=A0ABS5KEJ5_9BACT|nr:rhodanese-like domain-containing protein [Carboxylicivirga mesophila]MBS2213401.1 rhodanese-like domain-containing protein [Carboxylicivirga mesophila]